MAMIVCPECGKEISDKAKVCIHCGYPIEEFVPDGIVKIRVPVMESRSGPTGKQNVSISAGNNVLWKGKSGEIAELHFDGPTNIVVKYHTDMMHYGGVCSGTIDPQKSKRYHVSANLGILSTKLFLQPVDVFDAD